MAFYENKIMIPVDLLTIDYNKYIKINTEIGCIYKTIKEQGKVLWNVMNHGSEEQKAVSKYQR
jgi:hypothetical protein